jgi:hypothetical protein
MSGLVAVVRLFEALGDAGLRCGEGLRVNGVWLSRVFHPEPAMP